MPPEEVRSRPDPPGMKRASFYISEEAADALNQAANHVLDALGGHTPRHAVLSALLLAGAAQADAVTHDLATREAAALAARLETMQQAVNDRE